MYKHKTTLIKCFGMVFLFKTPITRNPDNSKQFQFPSAIRVTRVQLYSNCCWYCTCTWTCTTTSMVAMTLRENTLDIVWTLVYFVPLPLDDLSKNETVSGCFFSAAYSRNCSDGDHCKQPNLKGPTQEKKIVQCVSMVQKLFLYRTL